MKTIALFNHRGGVGKTTIVYHLAWMFQELGIRVLAVDLDPQASLTRAFSKDPGREASHHLVALIEALLEGHGRSWDRLGLENPGEGLALLPGHLDLSLLEDCNAAGLTEALRKTIRKAAEEHAADLTLVDLGPNLGALNRAALLACEHHLIPLKADSISLQSLTGLGRIVTRWQETGGLYPVGYILNLLSRRAEEEWLSRIAGTYHREILREDEAISVPEPDPYCLGVLRPYVGLSALSEDAHKPMFLLRPADGAVGGSVEAVQDCYRDFKELALRIASACGLQAPLPL